MNQPPERVGTMPLPPGRWVFSHCHACAENDEGEGMNPAGVGCPGEGPSPDCEAVWEFHKA